MKNLKQTVQAPVNFVQRHRVAIAIVATTVVCYKAHRNIVVDWNKFLKDHNLLDEYYALIED